LKTIPSITKKFKNHQIFSNSTNIKNQQRRRAVP